jgi:hypothetical protein
MPNVTVLFNAREIQAIKNDKINRLVAIKLARMSFDAYEHFSTYSWFKDFVAGLREYCEGNLCAVNQHERVIAYGSHKMGELYLKNEEEREKLMQKSNFKGLVTPAQPAFHGDNLIAL